jgi:hypothetical protein
MAGTKGERNSITLSPYQIKVKGPRYISAEAMKFTLYIVSCVLAAAPRVGAQQDKEGDNHIALSFGSLGCSKSWASRCNKCCPGYQCTDIGFVGLKKCSELPTKTPTNRPSTESPSLGPTSQFHPTGWRPRPSSKVVASPVFYTEG